MEPREQRGLLIAATTKLTKDKGLWSVPSQAKKVVARVHERIRNRRHNFIHQESRKIVNRYGLIAVEKLAVKNMSRRLKPVPGEVEGTFEHNGAAQKSGLNKSILDTGWSMFRHALAYKAESAGRMYIEVNPRNTTQSCSGCGALVPKKLKDRWHHCPECGISLNRDVNAAINIVTLGRQCSVA